MENTKQKRKLNPVLWFIFAIIIPFFLAITITVFILGMVGINVNDWVAKKTNNIPIISNVIKTKDEKLTEKKLFESNEKVQAQKEELSKLTEEISSLKLANSELDSLIQTQNDKVKELEEGYNQQEEESAETPAEEEKDDVAVASYRKMEPQNAAQIMEKMNEESAAKILSSLSGKVRGAILAEMDPDKAATLTEIILE